MFSCPHKALACKAVSVVLRLFMALLSFVESAPRVYRLKVSNAAPSFSTFPGTFPIRSYVAKIDICFDPAVKRRDARRRKRLEVVFVHWRPVSDTTG
jgi:hypothetical protein